MTEEFIIWLWQHRCLDPVLFLDSGEELTVLSTGTRNTDGGPDFFNARIRWGNTIWAGNIEIHVRASDWFRHGHQNDPAYNNTILHVVLEPDASVTTSAGNLIPVLVIKDRYPSDIYERFRTIINSTQWVPCARQLQEGNTTVFPLWAPVLAVEKLIQNSDTINHLWEQALFNWDESFYRRMAWCFGFRVNNTAFEMLARSLPLKIIQKNATELPQVEALLFGQAGMLEENFSEEYPLFLQSEYKHLRSKYNLQPFTGLHWQYLRMRPSNFPTIRISQWANLLHQTGGKFFTIMEHGDIPSVFREANVTTSEYWYNHYLFEKSSVFTRKALGRESTNLLMINGIVPFLFFYGLEKDDTASREKALGLLEQIDEENNAVIREWKSLGLTCKNALHSQALLFLKKHYCDRKRCLECRIGLEHLSIKQNPPK